MSSCLFLMPAVFADIKENVKNRTNNGRVSDSGNHRHIRTRTFFPFSVVRSSSSVPLSCIYCLCLINSPAFVPCGFCFQLLLYFSLVFFRFARALPFLSCAACQQLFFGFQLYFLKAFCLFNLSWCLALCENPDNKWKRETLTKYTGTNKPMKHKWTKKTGSKNTKTGSLKQRMTHEETPFT